MEILNGILIKDHSFLTYCIYAVSIKKKTPFKTVIFPTN